jgi:hypothetical protein
MLVSFHSSNLSTEILPGLQLFHQVNKIFIPRVRQLLESSNIVL